MSALRSHKGNTTVPGREKLRQTRRFLQRTRQRTARSSLLQGLRTFLTADSYMYGPLLESPPPPVHISSDSEPHTPGTSPIFYNSSPIYALFSMLLFRLVNVIAEDGGLEDDSTPGTTNGKEGDRTSGRDETPGRYQGPTKTILSYQRMARTERTLVPPADGNGTPSSTARVMPPRDVPLSSP